MAYKRGSHYGAFAKGFIDSLLASMKLADMMEYHQARERYWDSANMRGKNGMNAEERAVFNQGASGYSAGGGGGEGGGAAVSKNLAANQTEAYNAARAEGLNDSGARALVANLSGEGLGVPADVHHDGQHMAHGIAQWDDQRAAAIQQQFGKMPNQMSVTDQTKAAIWEMKTNPAYKQSWDTLNGDGDTSSKIRTLVTNYERPGNPERAINQRLAYAGKLPTTFKGEPATETAAATTPSKTAAAKDATTKDTTSKQAAKTGTGTGKVTTGTGKVTTGTGDKMSPAGGPYVTVKGKQYETDADGKIGKEAPAKSAQADTKGDGSYQLAGDTDIALSPEAAAKSRADLEAHRAAPSSAQRPAGSDPASAGAGPAPPPGSKIPASPPSDRGPGAGAAQPPPDWQRPGPEDPEIAARQTQGQGTMPPRPITGLQPSDMPSSGVAASGLPPRPQQPASTVPPTPPESGYPEPPAAPRTPPRTTTPSTAYDPSTVQGPSQPGDTGARPDLTARSPSTSSDTSRSAPATAPPPAIPSHPQGNQDAPGTVRYVVPNSQGSRAPIYTVGQWGSNPPLQKAASAPTPAAAPAPPPRQQDSEDWGGVASAPSGGDVSLGDQIMSAQRKGGPIQRFNKGGIPTRPTMRYAAAGAVAPADAQYPSYTPVAATTPGLQGNTLAADQFMTGLPGMQSVDLQNANPMYYTSYGPGQGGTGGQELTADWSMMTPAQQTQYSQMVAGTWQPPAATPAAVTPTATPAPVTNPTVSSTNAAPTTVSSTSDPTTGMTTTGAFNLPNTVAPTATFTGGTGTSGTDYSTTGTSTGTSASGTGSSGGSSSTGTNYAVATDDQLNQAASGMARGGIAGRGIPTRPVTRFALGGTPAMQAMSSPSYVGPTLQGGWQGAAESTLAPNQQAWATTEQGILGQELSAAHTDAAAEGAGAQTQPIDTMQYWNQLTTMPSAIWPTAAAAAPLNEAAPTTSSSTQAQTTVSDPTTSTTTGAVNLPNTMTPDSNFGQIDLPTNDFGATQNTGGTNYNVDTTGNATILSARGGPITPRVRRFADGGDVSGDVSASATGAPPGMGGQAPIPPIYFNPATYAGAGAPVGKGVSTTSAPTFTAGAIPSLPMALGGRVTKFADGGSADPGMDQSDYDPGGDQIDADVARRAATSDAGPQGSGMSDSGQSLYTPQDFAAPTGDARAPPVAASPGAGAPQQQQQGPPPGSAPWEPQIKDAQGNPSRGVTDAISGGLHWLASHLGLDGNQHGAIAGDPQTQSNRQAFASGQSADHHAPMDQQQMQQVHQLVDPKGQLDDNMRNLAGMEAVRNWMLTKGDAAGADKMAASMMQYSVSTAMKYGDQAAKRYYDGDLPGALKALNNSSDAVPDGRNIQFQMGPDGKSIVASDRDLNGRTVWQQQVAPQAILGAAMKMKDGSGAWAMLEHQAAKYDPQTAELVKQRSQERTWEHQQDIMDQRTQTRENEAQAKIDAKQKAMDDAAARDQDIMAGMRKPPGAPATGTAAAPAAPAPTPAPTPAPSPAAPVQVAGADKSVAPSPGAPSPDGAGGAQDHPASATADSNVAPALPPRPAPPAEPQVLPDPTQDPRWSQLSSAGKKAARDDYVDSLKANQTWQGERYKEQQADWQAGVGQQRTMETERYKTQSQGALQQQKEALDEHNADYADQIKRTAPRSDKDLQEMNADVQGSTNIPLARAIIPDAAAKPDLNDGQAQAMMVQAGYTPAMQHQMSQAFQNGLRMSSLSSRDEVASAIGQLAAGKDGKGQKDPRTGMYNISVANDDGSFSRITLPPEDVGNLQRLGTKFASSPQGIAAAVKNAPQPEERPSGAGSAPGIPSLQDWQTQATPSQQTIQPPM